MQCIIGKYRYNIFNILYMDLLVEYMYIEQAWVCSEKKILILSGL